MKKRDSFDPAEYSQSSGRDLWDAMVVELNSQTTANRTIEPGGAYDSKDHTMARRAARHKLRTDILYWLQVYTVDSSESSACLVALALLGDE